MKSINLIKDSIKKSRYYDEKKDKKILKLINKSNIKKLINILIKLLNDNRYRESILKIFRKIKQTKEVIIIIIIIDLTILFKLLRNQ